MKRNFVFTFLLILFSGAIVSAQSLRTHKWVISAGIGLGDAEASGLGMGLATGAYVGYRVGVFELGVAFQNFSKQTTGNGAKMGMSIDYNSEKPQHTSISIYEGTPQSFYSGSSHSLNLVAGIDPLTFIEGNDHHRLVLGFMAGVGSSIKANYYAQAPLYGSRVVTRGPLSWGGKLAYEYLLTERIGIGLWAMYDRPLDSFHALATINVHF